MFYKDEEFEIYHEGKRNMQHRPAGIQPLPFILFQNVVIKIGGSYLKPYASLIHHTGYQNHEQGKQEGF